MDISFKQYFFVLSLVSLAFNSALLGAPAEPVFPGALTRCLLKVRAALRVPRLDESRLVKDIRVKARYLGKLTSEELQLLEQLFAVTKDYDGILSLLSEYRGPRTSLRVRLEDSLNHYNAGAEPFELLQVEKTSADKAVQLFEDHKNQIDDWMKDNFEDLTEEQYEKLKNLLIRRETALQKLDQYRLLIKEKPHLKTQYWEHARNQTHPHLFLMNSLGAEELDLPKRVLDHVKPVSLTEIVAPRKKRLQPNSIERRTKLIVPEKAGKAQKEEAQLFPVDSEGEITEVKLADQFISLERSEETIEKARSKILGIQSEEVAAQFLKEIDELESQLRQAQARFDDANSLDKQIEVENLESKIRKLDKRVRVGLTRQGSAQEDSSKDLITTGLSNSGYKKLSTISSLDEVIPNTIYSVSDRRVPGMSANVVFTEELVKLFKKNPRNAELISILSALQRNGVIARKGGVSGLKKLVSQEHLWEIKVRAQSQYLACQDPKTKIFYLTSKFLSHDSGLVELGFCNRFLEVLYATGKALSR